MIEFVEFPKIARLSREVIVTEKIDGTNAQIFIECDDENYLIRAGSRNRWITPENDNFGFAAWVREHGEELISGLGPGRHFGEWWGSGFNTVRWCESDKEQQRIETGDPRQEKYQRKLPPCCHLVPVLYRGIFSTTAINLALADLERKGSYAAPGFMKPEGIVAYHVAGNVAFKKTIGNDGHKGA